MRRRLTAGLILVAACSAHAVLPAAAHAAAAGWRHPACERDGSAIAATAACTPPSDLPDEGTGRNTCLGADHCEVRSALPATAASGGRLSYGGWVSFYNYRGRRCRGTVRDGGHCAWLYHKYRVFEGGDPKGQIQVTSYPARSGNNDPSDKWVRNLGPIPNRFRPRPRARTRSEYRWGRMNGRFTGFESDRRESFYPGLWRLDPWVVYKPRTRHYRSAFEIHGGRNADGSSRLWTTRTQGCIRLSIAGILGLRGKWAKRTDNRRTARLYVLHNP
jgi:hypothetical protein